MQLKLAVVLLLCGGSAWAGKPAAAKSGGAKAATSAPAAAAAPDAACATPAKHDETVPDPRTLTDEQWQAYLRSQLRVFDDSAPKEEPRDPDPWAFSTFRGMRPEPMGKQTIINGAKMDIASLTVNEPPDVVEAEYLRAFMQAGVPAIRGTIPNTRGVRYLSYRRYESKTFKTITLVPNGRGTVVLASIGDPSQMLEKQPELPAGMPAPPNSTAAAVISQTETGLSNNSSSFVVKGTTVDQVRGFYRDEMGRRGFDIKKEGETDTYVRGSTLLSITARPHDAPGTVSVSVVWLE